ncbi:MAG: SusC/RagA family TonB-linked outer membrane protein [Porphyromonas sp.]|nr:SusC/RagA family TonB-linked outer membrane protein [Porphyromonas sp.]
MEGKKRIVALFLALFFPLLMWAQGRDLKGTVTDAQTGETLVGVSILKVGTHEGVVTDLEGNYLFPNVEVGDKLQFSYVGFNTVTITVESLSYPLNVALRSSELALQELVVVAYGTQDKKSFTGSLVNVKADELVKNRSNSVLSSLQGIVPGLEVTTKSMGGGRTSTDLLVRGQSTINASNEPLYIIDGVPSGSISNVNTEDIQSISVLKDPSSVSLYGARATNGVILITTKQGMVSGDKARITYNGMFGISRRMGKDYNQVSPQEYFELTWEAMRNAAVDNPNLLNAGGLSYPDAPTYATKSLVNRLGYNPFGDAEPVGMDGRLKSGLTPKWWEDYSELFNNNGYRHDHSVSISGASSRLRYYVSLGYLYQGGIEPGKPYFDRTNLRTNFTYDINKHLQTGVIIGLNKGSGKSTSIQGGYPNFHQYARMTPGLYPLYKRDAQGNIILDPSGDQILDFGDGPAGEVNSRRPDVSKDGVNPLGTLDLNKSTNESMGYNVSLFLTYTNRLVEWKTLYSEYYDNYTSHYYINRTIGSLKDKGSLNEGSMWSKNTTVNTVANFKWLREEDHKLTTLIGAEINDRTSRSMNTQVTDFPLEGMDTPNNAGKVEKPSLGPGTSETNRLMGFFSKLDYSYLDRYYLSASLRRDGSSNFHPDNRWGNFWSIGASWIASDEDFMKSADWVNYLKLRLSYGTTGNIGSNDYLSYYTMGYSYAGLPGYFIEELANPNLKWETNKQVNFGIDASFFQNRLGLTLDLYQRNTVDLFYRTPLTPSLGFKQVLKNIGELRNRGIEASINTTNVQTKGFRWDSRLTISRNVNEIIDLYDDEFVVGNYIYKVGQSTTEFFLPEFAGINPENGKPQWWIKDYNKDTGEILETRSKTESYRDLSNMRVTLTDGSYKMLYNLGKFNAGNFLPKVQGGLSNTFTYKDLDLSFLFTYSLGGKILAYDYAMLLGSGGGAVNAYHQDILNHWQKPGDDAKFQKMTTETKDNYSGGAGRSSQYVLSGDYLKLKSLTLGYTLRSQALLDRGVRSLRLYLQGDNLFQITAMQGLDPEQASRGEVINAFPALTTFSLGLRAEF